MTNPFDLKVGDGRGDGIDRVYVSERNGDVTEWTHANEQWSKTDIAKGVKNLAMLALGDARGDGVARLYFTELVRDGVLKEAAWTDGVWTIRTIGDSFQSLCLFIGEGRNDGSKHLYMGTYGDKARNDQGLWEYTYARGTWTRIRLTTVGMEGAGAVGDLRNDSVNRVLASSRSLEELTWNGTAYSSSPIDNCDDLWPDPKELGDVRNDGLTRILINSGHGKVEYVHRDGAWEKTVIDATIQRGDILVTHLKSDGRYRLYATHTSQSWGDHPLSKGPLKEYSWDPATSSYGQTIVVDAMSGATAKLDAGTGRNDGVRRLYAPDYEGGRIVEITSDDPFIEKPRAEVPDTRKTTD